MLFSALIIGLLIAILWQIALARPTRQNSKHTQSVYFGRRLILSVLVMVVILIAAALGWITPNETPYKT